MHEATTIALRRVCDLDQSAENLLARLHGQMPSVGQQTANKEPNTPGLTELQARLHSVLYELEQKFAAIAQTIG